MVVGLKMLRELKGWLLSTFRGCLVKVQLFPIVNLFPSFVPADLEVLYKGVELFEVKESLFSIGSLKAPSVDGFPACFFQNQWHICGPAIFNMVQQVFTDCQIPERLNATLITLVLKVTSAQTMIQFRPISLCSTLYKVIS